MPEYSISQLDNFEECPRQYKFRYVDKISRYEEGIIDRLMITPDGAYEVHDYKAGSKLPEQKAEKKP